MKMKIAGRVVSAKPISVSRAAKLISRLAAVESGSPPAVSLYLQRAADAFNRCNPTDFENIYSENLVREKEIINVEEAPAKTKKKRKRGGF